MRKRLIFMIPVSILFSLGSVWGQTSNNLQAGGEQPVRQTQEGPGAQPDSLVNREGPARETEACLPGPEGNQNKNKVKRHIKRVPGVKQDKSASSGTRKDLFGLTEPGEGEPGGISGESPGSKKISEKGKINRDLFSLPEPAQVNPGEPLSGTPAAKTESKNFVEQFYKESPKGEPNEEEREELAQKGAKLFGSEQPNLSGEGKEPGLALGEDDPEDKQAPPRGKKLFDQDEEPTPEEEHLQ